jgi:hypothetical protein
MSLIVRIDVDRPYGRRPLARHVLSRVSSDWYLPRVSAFGYLRELEVILETLNSYGAPSYIFFRKCTYPSDRVMQLIDEGGHTIGLHLENSRSFEMFQAEKRALEKVAGRKILACSKHGSGGAKFGFAHYAPYEPEKYLPWAVSEGMNLLLGNLEDPTIPPQTHGDVLFYPSAFWLEPSWRDTKRFTVDWLKDYTRERDVVMLIHPENVLADERLTAEFSDLVQTLSATTVGL